MCKHSRYGITAQHTGADMFMTAHTPCESPLSLAAEKAAQLHALLSMASDRASVSAGMPSASDNLNEELQRQLLSLAAGLAQETLVLSEMVVADGKSA